MNRHKYPGRELRRSTYSPIIEPEPIRVVIKGKLAIDYRCFKKTKFEKYQLKLAKLQTKIDKLNE